MSHQPERTEKNCLNCGITVAGRYCQACGQENIVAKQSAWGLVTHFVYDIFHFDGKFFGTLKRLLFRPGLVPREYVAGRRTTYLDPIRMYLFTSALFFLLFFSLKVSKDNIIKWDNDERSITKLERLDYASWLNQQAIQKPQDTVIKKQLTYLLDTTTRITISDPEKPTNDSSFLIRLNGKEYLMKVEGRKKESEIIIGGGLFSKTLKPKWQAYKKKFADDDRAMLTDLLSSFMHKFPYILFVSLPFFALILKLLYVRRKQFFYSDHAVFTLYHYIFTFILLLIYASVMEINKWLEWGLLSFLATILFLSGGLYLFIAMKRFYGQGWGKTLGKFLLLNILALIVIVLLMVVFVLLSIFQL